MLYFLQHIIPSFRSILLNSQHLITPMLLSLQHSLTNPLSHLLISIRTLFLIITSTFSHQRHPCGYLAPSISFPTLAFFRANSLTIHHHSPPSLNAASRPPHDTILHPTNFANTRPIRLTTDHKTHQPKTIILAHISINQEKDR